MPLNNSSVDPPAARHCQRGPNRAHDHFLRHTAQNDQAADHDVVARLHQTARRDVGKLRVGIQSEIVGFDRADTGLAVDSADDRRVGTGSRVVSTADSRSFVGATVLSMISCSLGASRQSSFAAINSSPR